MAIKPLNSVAGFSVGEYPYTTVIQANGDINTSNITTTGVANLNTISNVKISGGSSGQIITTDGAGNLSFTTISTDSISNGTSNVIVYNSGNIALSSAGTANVLLVTGTGANIAGTLNATGNANFGNVGATGGYFTTVSGSLTTSAQPNITSVGTLTTLDVSGNISAGGLKTDNLYYANGTAWDFAQPAGSNTQIQYNDGAGGFGASGNFTWDGATNLLSVIGTANITGALNVSANATFGNANAGNLLTANYVTGTLTTAAQPNITSVGTLTSIDSSGNITGPNIVANTGAFYGNAAGLTNIPGANVTGTVANATYATSAGTAGSATTAGTVTTNAQPNITSVGTLTDLTIAADGDITMSGTGSQLSGANLVSATYLSGTLTTAAQPNITSVGTLTSLDVSGNITAANITANTGIFAGNAAGLTNIPGANVTGTVANATTANTVLANTSTATSAYPTFVTSSANGWQSLVLDSGITANLSNNSITATTFVGSLSGTATSATTAGTVTTNAQPNITSVGTLSSLNVSGNANTGNLGTTQVVATGNITTSANLVTDYIVAKTANLNIAAASGNNSIVLTPTGTGVIDGSGKRIANIASPVQASDAATKYYVDNAISAGLNFHTAVTVEAPLALTTTYANGGTTPTVTDISGGNLLTTSTNHGLSIGDVIVFDVSSNGLTAGVPYFVYTTPALNTLTLSSTYSGTPVTGLTDGTGLTLASRANAGVGATLTNAGTQAALQIDGVNLSVGNRVLLYQQTNSYENGIYTVTNVGSGSTNWVLTRATDSNKYIPNSNQGMSEGDYVYVQQGLTGAGESYVNATVGVVVFGTTNITYSQFSDTQIYTAGTGLTLTGTQFSISNTTVTTGSYGNGDRVATFTVNSQGQLTAASNVAITANAANLTGTTLASSIVTSSLTSVGNLISLTVTGNASAGNISTTGTLSVTGNANVGNIGATNGVFTIVSGNGSALSSITGANVTGQVGNALVAGTVYTNAQPNITSVGTLSSLSVTGNVSGGNLIGTLANGTSNIAIPASGGNVNITAGGTTTLVITSTGANIAGTVNATGNATFANVTATNGNLTTANVSGNIIIGNSTVTTAVSWASVTTTSISANQAIASFTVTGITGVEFLVKGVDATGSKYSVATVQAVTDGTNVDYSTFGGVNLGGYTGTFTVAVSGGLLKLQVTPASSNSTVWTTQYRFI